MKTYFTNLMIALMGNNPYQMELDRVREEYEKTAARVKLLDDLHYASLETAEEVDKQVNGLQAMIENQRERLKEKDALLEQQGEEYRRRVEQMKSDYQRRIDDYNQKIDDLQKQLNAK